ncbi:PREDICTED: pentatricopeptide repeat-containing protein At4g17616 isoform X2 [Nelumbo nucifera]|nr:PREDICTED: pentatricopeptide repeat-containing protein At4g17616 isoform X2 [Nelumbo nucifera]
MGEDIHNSLGTRLSHIFHKSYRHQCSRYFSSAIQPGKICWEASSHEILLQKLENALKDQQMGEALDAFNDFRNLYGFPKHSLVRRLITELSYSSDSHWLRKAYDLVLLISKEKSTFLNHDCLTLLALSLARAQMPIPASTVLRLMMEKHKFLQKDILRMVFIHMVKTEIGTYLASDILVEICDFLLNHMAYRREKSFKGKLINPDTMIFNLVLDACVRFKSTLKAQQIVELLAQVGVVADANSIVIISRIHEINGQRDELKKFKEHIDVVSAPFLRHYRQFYDSLLNLHFKFNDIDSASRLVLDMYHERSCCCSDGLFPRDRKDSQNPRLVPVGSGNLRAGLRMCIEPELLQKDFVLEMENRPELVLFMNGKFVLSNKALAKLIVGNKRDGKVGEISKLLISIQKMSGSLEVDLISDVINACIQLCWLEIAHDILDDMESAGMAIGSATHVFLLRAYCKENMFKEAMVVLKQMRKAGLLVDLSDEEVISSCLLEEGKIGALDMKSETSVGKLGLVESLTQEIREEEKAISSIIYTIDSSVYFFCKAKMMEDALKTYRKMQDRKLCPTVHTFANLVNGYSSLEMYREITILWGEIKRRMDTGDLAADRDLHDFVLWNLIRGGYFERAMEVLSYMTKHNMYIDKWKHKRVFLKFHKDLYRNLKASKAKTEAQKERIEHVRAFRKWSGID